MKDAGLGIKGLAHIGIPSNNVERTRAFFDALGFAVTAREVQPDGEAVLFMEQAGVELEIYAGRASGRIGAIEHIALETEDIEVAYRRIRSLGYRILEGEICRLDFERGPVRYFTVAGPDQEKIEFCRRVQRNEE